MRTVLAATFLASLLSSAAYATTSGITIPSFTLTSVPSTGTVCTPTAAASGLASAAPAGTIMFNCIVSPVGWLSATSGIVINDPALQVMNIVVPSTATTPTFQLGLISAGVAQTYPAGSGTTTP